MSVRPLGFWTVGTKLFQPRSRRQEVFATFSSFWKEKSKQSKYWEVGQFNLEASPSWVFVQQSVVESVQLCLTFAHWSIYPDEFCRVFWAREKGLFSSPDFEPNWPRYQLLAFKEQIQTNFQSKVRLFIRCLVIPNSVRHNYAANLRTHGKVLFWYNFVIKKQFFSNIEVLVQLFSRQKRGSRVAHVVWFREKCLSKSREVLETRWVIKIYVTPKSQRESNFSLGTSKQPNLYANMVSCVWLQYSTLENFPLLVVEKKRFNESSVLFLTYTSTVRCLVAYAKAVNVLLTILLAIQALEMCRCSRRIL